MKQTEVFRVDLPFTTPITSIRQLDRMTSDGTAGINIIPNYLVLFIYLFLPPKADGVFWGIGKCFSKHWLMNIEHILLNMNSTAGLRQ